jgi:hypothetical protein
MQQVKQGAGDVHAVFWSAMPLLDFPDLCHPRPAASFVYLILVLPVTSFVYLILVLPGYKTSILLIVFLCCWIQATQDHHKQVS